METLTYSQLIEKLSGKGARIVGIEAVTDARARKTGNPHGTITKKSRSVGFVGANYENAVKREGERQGAEKSNEFSSEGLPWGSWHLPGKVIEHKGEFYLRAQNTPGQRKRQPAKVLEYRAENGAKLTFDQVKSFLPEKKTSEKQAVIGLTDDVRVNNYKFSSIQKIRIGGMTYQLVK